MDAPGGGSTTANSVLPSGDLAFSPGRIEPASTAFNASRKPLAGQFTYAGKKLFVIVNHFNSKGGDEPLWGHAQPPARPSETQRHQQATIVRDFSQTILAANPSGNVVVLGDLNDFHFSQTVSILEATPLHTLLETLPANEQYTYVFEGNSQSLDHILVSDAIFAKPFAYDVVHVNAEFADQASDHDPQLVKLVLNRAPSVSAGGPYTVAEGGSTGLSASGSDPDGDTLAYAWDLDDNGTFETTGQSPSFTWDDGPATRTVTVQASDPSGATATASSTVTVTNVAPTGDVHRAGHGAHGDVHADVHRPDRPVHGGHDRGIHVRVRLRLGLRRVRLSRLGDVLGPDGRHPLGRRPDPRQGRRRHRVPGHGRHHGGSADDKPVRRGLRAREGVLVQGLGREARLRRAPGGRDGRRARRRAREDARADRRRRDREARDGQGVHEGGGEGSPQANQGALLRGKPMAGDIVHVEFPAEDVDRAQSFWSGLFGWEFGESQMPDLDYRMARTGENSGVAVWNSDKGTGHPSYYFDVDDIEAARAKVVELGGSAEDKTPVPGMGWFTECKDSEGNIFSLWQTDSNAG